jgi:hypothetical protein
MAGMLIACFVFRYVGAEHPVYIWDWGGYFSQYRTWGQLYSEDPHGALAAMMAKIRFEDYNGSSVAFLMPFYFFLGPDRAAYVFGIIFSFLIPAGCVSYHLSKMMLREEPPQLAKIAVCCFIFLFPPFWQSALRGMPDVIGLIPLGLASIILLKTQFLQKDLDKPLLSVRHALLFGALVWLTFLFRRWYAYSAVALFGCAFLVAMWQSWAAKKNLGGLVSAAIPFVVAGLTGLACLIIFQFDLAIRVAQTDYSYFNVAYQTPVGEHFRRYLARSGPVAVGLFALGFCVAVWQRRMNQLFFVAVALISGILFGLTQAPGVQHNMPVVFFLMPTAILPIVLFFKSLRLRGQVPALAIIVATTLIVFMSSFSASFPRLSPFFAKISPTDTYPPLHYNQFSEYQRLIAFLHQTLQHNQKVAVFASSPDLSDSLILAIDPTLSANIVPTSNVDERDGFRTWLLEAEFAVIATPAPLHLPESSQRVVTVPTDMIRTGTGVGIAYQQIAGPFALENGVQAFVYRRTRPVNEDDVRTMEAALRVHHPDWRSDGAGLIKRPEH